MSLSDQSQQWFPTSVQVTVHQARNLRAKGKNGTNDAYAIIQVAKDKFSTCVVEKSVAPVWKEEATFDLPLFHPGNAERCTLYVIVMHRAQMGLDKLLGQAVVNLVDLHENKSRKKQDWFKLVDKAGKEDKPRGEVLLNVQFMRNNMSASMFDLSMQDKPRSRISKLKDKVRGKKKDGFSDSASAIVPPVSQVLTDSDAEADAQSLNLSPGVKKKSKLKSLFAPKSNLQRNISQSMSTLGSLPEKNSSLSGSRSSGLNVDSPEGKHKLKFLGHKRTGSSDSKVSQGPFSLLGRSKQSNSDQNNLCINGSHVYAEEAESKSGSTVSLNSSGQGSAEDISRNTFSADHFKTVPSIQVESDRARLEQQRHQEEEERRQAEERRIAEAKRLEEEEKYRLEAERLQEEQERRRRFLEDEVRRKKQKEMEEEERKKQEEVRRMLEAAENQKLEEERRKVEEQKRQEEASMTDRLTTLFGIIRKKEEKKEGVQQLAKEELPVKPPRTDLIDPTQPVSIDSTNPFEDIPLTSDPPVSPDDHHKSSHNPQTPSAMVFLNRTTKVSAVKPRFTQSLESETTDCQTPSQLCPSPATSESTFSSVPSESPDTFSILHSSLAPANISQNPPGFPGHSEEDLSVGSLPVMADKKKRVPLPPSHPVHGTQIGGNNVAGREINSPTYSEGDGSQQGKKISIPLPDYDTLFPQKRHGVQGITRWDHIIAEVNQRHRDSPPELVGKEMSVDDPVEHRPSSRPSVPQESPAMRIYQPNNQETPPVSSKKVPPPLPAKASASPHPRPADPFQRQSQNIAQQSPIRTTTSAVPGSVNADLPSRESPSVRSRDGEKKLLPPPPAPRQVSQTDWDTRMPDDQRKVHVAVNQEATRAKPRQRANEPVGQADSAVPTVVPDKYMNSNIQTLSTPSVSRVVKDSQQIQENFAVFDPFPSMDLLSNDPWAQVEMKQDFFTGSVQKENKLEDLGMTPEDLDKVFHGGNPTDPFASFNGNNANTHSEYRGKDFDLKQGSTAVQSSLFTKNSEKENQILPAATHQDVKTLKYQQEPTTKTTVNNGLSARNVSNDFNISKPQPDVKTQSHSYGREDPFVAEPFNVITSFSPREPLEVVMEEPEFQAGNLSGGKTPLRAWVSPSEVLHVNAQNSSGGGLALPPRRPHPVKPMNTVEIQQPIGHPAVKDIKIYESTPRKIQVAENLEGGPYTQLTQEELITLVVKQQTDLSRKDAKIVELEEYIDNLLVRVIEEKPSILHSLDSFKPV